MNMDRVLSNDSVRLSNKELFEYMKLSSDWRVEKFYKPNIHYVITATDKSGNDIYINNDYRVLSTSIKGKSCRGFHRDFTLFEMFKEFTKHGKHMKRIYKSKED